MVEGMSVAVNVMLSLIIFCVFLCRSCEHKLCVKMLCAIGRRYKL